MSTVRVEWHGPAMQKRIRAITEDALRETIDKAASAARSQHGWKSRSGKLQAGIDYVGLESSKDGLVGSFGYSEPYGLFQEIGFRGHPGDHTLRRAGDREFTSLAGRIAGKF